MPPDPFAVRLRLYVGTRVVMGPGKADLLELIEETGSIAESAREMDMSYKRAWSLVKGMNESFAAALVEREVGGRKGGGAQLTDLGREILAAYRAAERAAQAAAAAPIARIRDRLDPEDSTAR